MKQKLIHFPIIVNHRTGKIRHARDEISWLTKRTYQIHDIKVVSGEEKGYPDYDGYWIATMNNGETYESLWSDKDRLYHFLTEHFGMYGIIIDWYGELIYPE